LIYYLLLWWFLFYFSRPSFPSDIYSLGVVAYELASGGVDEKEREGKRIDEIGWDERGREGNELCRMGWDGMRGEVVGWDEMRGEVMRWE
jgi:serine/threonine protein kinase